MFKWLRNKMIKGSEKDFNKRIDVCYAFIKFAQEKELLSPTSIDVGIKFDFPNISTKLGYMYDELRSLSESGYNGKAMSKLLDLDMECRKLWAIAYGQSNLKYNQTFLAKID
jgi:hypothetical protein